jgi:hypothetical protein
LFAVITDAATLQSMSAAYVQTVEIVLRLQEALLGDDGDALDERHDVDEMSHTQVSAVEHFRQSLDNLLHHDQPIGLRTQMTAELLQQAADIYEPFCEACGLGAFVAPVSDLFNDVREHLGEQARR